MFGQGRGLLPVLTAKLYERACRWMVQGTAQY